MAAVATFDQRIPDILMASTSSPSSSSPFDPNAPTFTPLAEIKLRADAAEFIPIYGGFEISQAAAAAAYRQQQQLKNKQKMPPATDAEWELRIAKREKEVSTIKSLPTYRLYNEALPHDKRGDDDPKTPDARDRTVSKRMWKWNVEKWRLQLKSHCVYSPIVMLRCREHMLLKDDRDCVDSFDSMPGNESSESANGGSSPKEGCKEDCCDVTAEPILEPGVQGLLQTRRVILVPSGANNASSMLAAEILPGAIDGNASGSGSSPSFFDNNGKPPPNFEYHLSGPSSRPGAGGNGATNNRGAFEPPGIWAKHPPLRASPPRGAARGGGSSELGGWQ